MQSSFKLLIMEIDFKVILRKRKDFKSNIHNTFS